jgi:hypothetical protein
LVEAEKPKPVIENLEQGCVVAAGATTHVCGNNLACVFQFGGKIRNQLKIRGADAPVLGRDSRKMAVDLCHAHTSQIAGNGK